MVAPILKWYMAIIKFIFKYPIMENIHLMITIRTLAIATAHQCRGKDRHFFDTRREAQ